MISIIGKSKYGKVMLVKGKRTGIMYTLKVIKKTEINRAEALSSEKPIMDKICHSFLVEMKYAFQNDTKFFFVMEYCSGGDLSFYLKKIGRLKENVA